MSSYHEGYQDGYASGLDAGIEQGFKDGFEKGMIEGHNHYEKHKAAELAAKEADMLNRAMDARIDALLAADTPAKRMAVCDAEAQQRIYAKKAVAEVLLAKPMYQGVNDLCAYCGQPVGDTPVRDQDDKANTYLYCSDKCWQLHGWG